MERVQTKLRRGEGGFTLVELAIVMIIIGLLITGILKGQEMIGNAQVASTVSQMKGIDAALSTFRDTYNALPGDMARADERLPNCANECDTDGDGNGRIDGAALAAAQAVGDENTTVWTQLAVADLITGISDPSIAEWGAAYPSAPVGGGLQIAFDAGGAAGAQPGTGNLRGGHWLQLLGDPAAGAGNLDVLSATQAARVDRKLDDGAPDTGSVIAGDEGGTCIVASSGSGINIYDEAVDNISCHLFVRVQG